MTTQEVEDLIQMGYIQKCPCCAGLGCLALRDKDADHGIVPIAFYSANGWQCPHCKRQFVTKEANEEVA